VTGNGLITNVRDSEGRRIQSTYQNFQPVSYTFDGLGQRVKKASAHWPSTVFVFDAFGQLAAEYGTATAVDCGTCYPIADSLGSTRLVANENGDAVQRFDWTPFGPAITEGTAWSNGRSGTQWDAATAVKQQFGGHYLDDLSYEGKIDFFGARDFQRSFGRFLSPDENLMDQDPADPLSWNLYTFVRNNPLRYTDPTGRACKEEGEFTVDDRKGKPCNFALLHTAHAKAEPVALADFERSHGEWASAVIAEIGNRTSDGSVVIEGYLASREWRSMIKSPFAAIISYYVPAPDTLVGFPNARRSRSKTPMGGGKLRRRWKDSDGNIYEWDYQHGTVEKYNRRGRHQGEFDAATGRQTKSPDATRDVEP
jgi:RHS repeat-associated protein